MKAKIFMLALLALCLSGSTAMAKKDGREGRIQGVIKDSGTGNPLEFATAILLKADDTTKVVSSAMADQAGLFTFNEVPAGSYKLRVAFMGYDDTNTSVAVNMAQPDVNVGTLALKPHVNELGGAVVSARVPTIERKIDKLVMNVEGAVSTAGNTALEVLKKAPGVTVDQDGNIKLLGSGVLVQLDGRATYLSAADLATLLEGMDASEITKIEIINNPSSNQDAQGSSGIINIRTRKSVLSGINGSLNAGVTAAKLWSYNGGASVNYRNAWVGAYGSYNYRFGQKYNTLDQTRNFFTATPPSVFHSYAEDEFKANRDNYRFGLDFYLNKKNTLGFLLTGNNNDMDETTDAATSTTTSSGVVSRSESNNNGNEVSHGMTLNANYLKTFATDGQKLSANADYAKYTYTQSQSQANHFYDVVHGLDSLMYVNTYSPRSVEVYSGKVDYVQPWGKTTQVEFGAKLSQSKTNNLLDWQNGTSAGVWTPDANRSNDFEYTERVTAAYASWAKQLGEKFSMKLGLRWENTWTEGVSSTVNQDDKHTYNNLFPTIFFQYKPTEKHDFTLSYNRRIERPDYDNLNPFRSYIDAYTYIAGNPDLRPQLSDNVSLTYGYSNALISTLFYKRETDLIVQIPEQNEAMGESGVIQGNFGYSDMVGLNVSLPSLPVVKWWVVSSNVTGFWQHSHSMQNSTVYDNYGLSATGNLSNTFTVHPTCKFELSANASTPLAWGYFNMGAQYWMSIGFKKTFLDNKLNLSVNFDDPFQWGENSIDVNYDKFSYHYEATHQSRRFRVALVWRFGKNKSAPANNRKGGNEDELSRIKE